MPCLQNPWNILPGTCASSETGKPEADRHTCCSWELSSGLLQIDPVTGRAAAFPLSGRLLVPMTFFFSGPSRSPVTPSLEAFPREPRRWAPAPPPLHQFSLEMLNQNQAVGMRGGGNGLLHRRATPRYSFSPNCSSHPISISISGARSSAGVAVVWVLDSRTLARHLTRACQQRKNDAQGGPLK